MSPEAPASRKERLLAGSAATAVGVFGLVMMSLHPEGLRVPAWVGFAAMSTFVWGGCAIALANRRALRYRRDADAVGQSIGSVSAPPTSSMEWYYDAAAQRVYVYLDTLTDREDVSVLLVR